MHWSHGVIAIMEHLLIGISEPFFGVGRTSRTDIGGYAAVFCLREWPVSRRRFEMFQYRQVLVRLRQGDSDRDIAPRN